MLNKYDVIIVGAGPAGIFSAIELVRKKEDIKVLILEKGRDIDNRKCPSKTNNIPCINCNPCSMVSGWGGAGAFSDGKLTLSNEIGGNLDLYISQKYLSALIEYVDGIYLEFGAPSTVYGMENQDKIANFQSRATRAELKLIPVPIRHLGTGRCQQILRSMKEYLISKGVEVETGIRVDNVLCQDNKAIGVITGDGKKVYSDYVILAPGREGSQWLVEVARELGINTEVNPVDIGVRVELPAEIMEPLTNVFYESKFIYHSKTFDDKVRTFCMNPYGDVVLENSDGIITVNGHSHAFRKTANTNFAILVSKSFTEPFKEPIAYGKYVASLANLLGGGVIVQRLGDLIAGKRTTEARLKKSLTVPTLEEATPGDLSLVFPYRHLVAIVEMLKAMDIIAPGVYSRYTLLYGVEVKFYSSRLTLSSCLETPVRNLFACGDGAGVTRGLAQASAAGVIVAREVANRLIIN